MTPGRGMLSAVADAEIAITPTPTAHFGAGAIAKLPADTPRRPAAADIRSILLATP
jgi:hypothetical protein